MTIGNAFIGFVFSIFVLISSGCSSPNERELQNVYSEYRIASAKYSAIDNSVYVRIQKRKGRIRFVRYDIDTNEMFNIDTPCRYDVSDVAVNSAGDIFYIKSIGVRTLKSVPEPYLYFIPNGEKEVVVESLYRISDWGTKTEERLYSVNIFPNDETFYLLGKNLFFKDSFVEFDAETKQLHYLFPKGNYRSGVRIELTRTWFDEQLGVYAVMLLNCGLRGCGSKEHDMEDILTLMNGENISFDLDHSKGGAEIEGYIYQRNGVLKINVVKPSDEYASSTIFHDGYIYYVRGIKGEYGGFVFSVTKEDINNNVIYKKVYPYLFSERYYLFGGGMVVWGGSTVKYNNRLITGYVKYYNFDTGSELYINSNRLVSMFEQSGCQD